MKDICNKLNTLENSLLDNEGKANELRKIYEKFFKILLSFSEDDKTKLYDLMVLYFETYNDKAEFQYICHNLRDLLNTWAHDTPKSLGDKELSKYIKKFRHIIYSLTEYNCIENNTDKNNKFLLENYNLNQGQEKSILSEGKFTLVNAGPGTGKTYLIVARILNEISNNNNKNIYALSFTNKASNELKYRIDDWIFETDLWIFRNNIFAGTLHSFSLNIIKHYFKNQNKDFDYVIIDENELKEIKENIKNNEELNDYLKKHKLLTFDNIIKLFIDIIKNDEKFQIFISNYLDEIIIDEAQDLDEYQYEILKLLNEYIEDLKLFFVGDQRQNIYRFRGGSLDNIKLLSDEKIEIEQFELEHSYRCPHDILNFVNQFEFFDCKNPQLKNALNNEGNIKFHEFDNMEEEAIWISNLVKLKEKSVGLNNISVLFSNTFYFTNILKLLNINKIPFKVFGGQYFLQKEIKILKDILNFIYINKKESHFLNNIQIYFINKIEGKTINDILKYNGFKSEGYIKLFHILNFLKKHENTNVNVLDIINEYINLIYENKIFKEKSIELYNDFRHTIEENIILNNYDTLKTTLSPLDSKFSKYYLRSDELVKSTYYNEDKDYLVISTIHGAKGLEWDEVIIPGMSHNSFPRYSKYINSNEINDELKKFYVACTRSKNNLYLTRAIINHRGYENPKSVFLKNL